MTERVAVVTGASRGIGAAIAQRLAADGFFVYVNHRASAREADDIVERIRAAGGDAESVQADVSQLDGARALMSHVRQGKSKLDVLVNNAGRSDDGLLLLTPDEKWWATFRDNVAMVVHPSRAALPLLLAARGAALVNVASISGIRGVEGQTAYSAAKAAVIGFTKSLAREIATKNVSVNCVAPGPIETEMYETVSESRRAARLAFLPLQRIGQPEEVAEVVALLASRRATFVHGQVIAIDGGMT